MRGDAAPAPAARTLGAVAGIWGHSGGRAPKVPRVTPCSKSVNFTHYDSRLRPPDCTIRLRSLPSGGAWSETPNYEPDLDRAARPFYNLMMFPYPSPRDCTRHSSRSPGGHLRGSSGSRSSIYSRPMGSACIRYSLRELRPVDRINPGSDSAAIANSGANEALSGGMFDWATRCPPPIRLLQVDAVDLQPLFRAGSSTRRRRRELVFPRTRRPRQRTGHHGPVSVRNGRGAELPRPVVLPDPRLAQRHVDTPGQRLDW